jgi:urease accessory protein
MDFLEIHEKLESPAQSQTTLPLPFEIRQKSRFRAVLSDGTGVGVFMPRGTLLRGGDTLKAADGRVVQVEAAPERVSTATADDPLLLARACYHLGNRHVPLQIGAGWVRYLHDHVLDDMVHGLGLRVRSEEAPFEPEPGAYGGHSHAHGHSHEPA